MEVETTVVRLETGEQGMGEIAIRLETAEWDMGELAADGMRDRERQRELVGSQIRHARS